MSPDSNASSTAVLLAAAAQVITRVTAHGRALDDAIATVTAETAVPKPALQALTYGALRWYLRIDHWINAMLDRPADLKQPELRALLSVGLYQLAYSNHPQHAIVHQSVEAARLLKLERSAKLVNALLRRFLREQATIQNATQNKLTSKYSHFQWFIDRLRKDWPDRWQAILEASNESPPLWLRVNTQMVSPESYLQQLNDNGMRAASSRLLIDRIPEAVLMDTPVDVRMLPNFAAGHASVQDAGAQLAASLLDARAGMRVLDACAAPGGKACHILERTPAVSELIALDRASERLGQIHGNLQRLNLTAQVIEGDAGTPADWWDGRPFQRILLDIPCSATGVIRRHPDIKLLRRAADVDKLAREQARLLRGVWPTLAPGGRLLYVSCSILRAENEAIVGAFLECEPGATAVPIDLALPAAVAVSAGPGVQIIPGGAGLDGFYYACLEKRH